MATRLKQCLSVPNINCLLSPSPLCNLMKTQSLSQTPQKNLGVVLDNTLSMQSFISQTAQSCYCQLRRISSIRKYLSTDTAAKLVTSLILSRLDYCNALLSGLPASSTQVLQRIQNSAAGLVLKKKKKIWPHNPTSSVSALAPCFPENQIQNCHPLL